MSKIIGIVGSRRRVSSNDYNLVRNKFLELYEDGDWICSGGCPTGADAFAIMLKKEFETPYLEFPARWKKEGRSAGFNRNGQIAQASDVLVACVHDSRTGGTEDTVRKFIILHGEEKVYLV